jgi:hypothetical protein
VVPALSPPPYVRRRWRAPGQPTASLSWRWIVHLSPVGADGDVLWIPLDSDGRNREPWKNVGVISCPDLLPDLWRLVDDFDVALEELLDCAVPARS